MRMFGVPFDINEEDKIIGGYVSLRQAGWLAIPLMTFALLIVPEIMNILKINWLILILKVIVFLIVGGLTAFMAFGSMDNTNADTYVFKMVRFNTRNKKIKYSEKI